MSHMNHVIERKTMTVHKAIQKLKKLQLWVILTIITLMLVIFGIMIHPWIFFAVVFTGLFAIALVQDMMCENDDKLRFFRTK